MMNKLESLKDKKIKYFKEIIIGKINYKKVNSFDGYMCSEDKYYELENGIAVGEKALSDLIEYYGEYKDFDDKREYIDPFMPQLSIYWLNKHKIFSHMFGDTEYFEVAQDILTYSKKIFDSSFDNFIYYCEKTYLNKKDCIYEFDDLHFSIKTIIERYNKNDLDSILSKKIKRFIELNKELISYYNNIDITTDLFIIKLFETMQFKNVLKAYTDIKKEEIKSKYNISEKELNNAYKYCKLTTDSNKGKYTSDDIKNILKISELELLKIQDLLYGFSIYKSKRVQEFIKDKGNEFNSGKLSVNMVAAIEDIKQQEQDEIDKTINNLSKEKLIFVKEKILTNDEAKLYLGKSRNRCGYEDVKEYIRKKFKEGKNLW